MLWDMGHRRLVARYCRMLSRRHPGFIRAVTRWFTLGSGDQAPDLEELG